MSRRSGRLAATASAIIALLLPGCASTDWIAAAEKSIAWAAKTEAQASLFALLYEGRDGSHDTLPEDFAGSAAQDVQGRLPGCVAVQTAGPTVTYTFTACPAARGLDGLDGTVVATYDLNDMTADRVGVSFAGQGVRLGARTLDLALAGGNSPAAPKDRFSFQLADTAPPATNTESRDALLALSGDFGDRGCGEAAGSEQSPAGLTAAHGFVGVDDAEAWTIDVSAYRRCGRACPVAGATIEVELAEKVRVVFDGTASAHAENVTTGDAADLPVACAP